MSINPKLLVSEFNRSFEVGKVYDIGCFVIAKHKISRIDTIFPYNTKLKLKGIGEVMSYRECNNNINNICDHKPDCVRHQLGRIKYIFTVKMKKIENYTKKNFKFNPYGVYYDSEIKKNTNVHVNRKLQQKSILDRKVKRKRF